MKSLRRILSLVLAFAICFSTLFLSKVNVFADSSETFLLEISAPETALAGDTIDVVITIKDIEQELYGVEFILEYDETKLSPVYTNHGADMDVFMTVVPMYIMSVNGIEIETKAFEQICTCDTKNGRYTCRFLDLIAYPMEKPGQIHNSLINDGDLVVTIPFVVKDTVSYGDTLDFHMVDGSVKGTFKKTVTSTKGTSTTASTRVVDNKIFEIKFVDENGNEISSKTYHYGDTVVVPEAPEKVADKTYTYKFAGWDKDVTTVTGNATYKATYTSEYIDYTIKFVDENGNEISSKTYHYGDTVIVPEAPIKDTDKLYSYIFLGWDKDVVAVTSDEVYTATYSYYCSQLSENDDYYIDVENRYMKNIPEKTLVSDVVAAFAKFDVSITIKDKNGNAMNGNRYIATGCTLTEEYGNEYTVIIMGDVDGSGVVDSTDYVIIKKVFLKSTSLVGAYFVAADTETDGAITSTDYIQIKKYFLGTRDLYN